MNVVMAKQADPSRTLDWRAENLDLSDCLHSPFFSFWLFLLLWIPLFLIFPTRHVLLETIGFQAEASYL